MPPGAPGARSARSATRSVGSWCPRARSRPRAALPPAAPGLLPVVPCRPPHDRPPSQPSPSPRAEVPAMTAPAIPDLVLESVAIDSLVPDPANPRRIEEPELEALTRSVSRWGMVQPVLARREDRVVIGGHQRLLA